MRHNFDCFYLKDKPTGKHWFFIKYRGFKKIPLCKTSSSLDISQAKNPVVLGTRTNLGFEKRIMMSRSPSIRTILNCLVVSTNSSENMELVNNRMIVVNNG